MSRESGEAETTRGEASFRPRYLVLRSIMEFSLLSSAPGTVFPSRFLTVGTLTLFRTRGTRFPGKRSRRLFLHRGRRFGLPRGQVLVHVETFLHVLLRGLPQPLRIFRLALGEHLEARLLQQILLHLPARSARIERQRILPSLCLLRVIPIQQPLA